MAAPAFVGGLRCWKLRTRDDAFGIVPTVSVSAEMSEPSELQIESVEGVVKWFDPRKGYGFIVGPDGQDVFTHFSVIDGDGFRVLRDGAKVTYNAVKSDKGWRATRVERPDPPEIVTRQGRARSPRR